MAFSPIRLCKATQYSDLGRDPSRAVTTMTMMRLALNPYPALNPALNPSPNLNPAPDLAPLDARANPGRDR